MSTGPLDGYKVVELSQGIPAAVAGMHLGDGGADVVKVEHLGGDVARGMPPFYAGGDSGVFVAVNRNKRGIEIDLTSAPAHDVLRALIRDDKGPKRRVFMDGDVSFGYAEPSQFREILVANHDCRRAVLWRTIRLRRPLRLSRNTPCASVPTPNRPATSCPSIAHGCKLFNQTFLSSN